MTGPAPSRRPIQRLSSETVERIAAGEVVERPASVVKELLENALDAGATSVVVRLENGGLGRIEVADDGGGIPPGELELAVERHATSKIAPEGPIDRIDTLGFRGEALAAIATVSRFRLLSRPTDRDLAEGLSVVGGTIAGRFVAPRAPGTTVEVEDLFFNTPARQKFLKSPAAEQVEVVQTVERMFLARPSVAIRVESEGREVAAYPATSHLLDAATRVLGGEFRHHSLAVSEGIAGGRIHGVLGRPSLSASSARSLHLAVNGRPVVSRPLQQAVRAAYGDYLPRVRFPVGVIHLEIDAARLDVNVHPTKREVRLEREREIAESIRVAVRNALKATPSVAEVGAAGARALPPAPGPERPGPRAMPAVRSVAARLLTARSRGQQQLGPSTDTATAAEVPGTPTRPRLTLLGCIEALYWIAASDDGLVLIDQHAASERLLYEALLRAGTLGRQILVEPVSVRLTGAQRATLAARAAEVARAGFEVDAFGPETYRVRSVPSYRGQRARPEALAELLDELAAGGRPTIPDGLAERAAATLACHAAIRAGDVVSVEEFTRVLDALGALPDAPPSCPHGRPILVGIPRARLDRWFLRSGA